MQRLYRLLTEKVEAKVEVPVRPRQAPTIWCIRRFRGFGLEMEVTP